MTTCPITKSGEHDVEWLDVPPMLFNGEQVGDAHQRGFCWACDERFCR